ncbi:tRNA uridine-5-carboxymethylaminomethyl(34) synthesis GTPase MnmE [Desulfuromonas carbonis]|uniref:tRNA uridine-5-carboxymethylaminomethyl(34) synthesis GTPase MnmE n=1 Tax=Desulfuromonas sp. DDH964 TaxID=1823759 RepID=UPI00078CECB5|nr:tRNA uridine-5-carboxymethylaminomethyl(34) synthesis GTPase MnmE [Desulfuromonas sp. DDH964]AMV73972.1 tRNA modification GTPase TrmE [Desulfuromonas sp. DDH964]
MLKRGGDTIVGPATPPGEGGVAIIRLSGSDAETLLRRFFVPSGNNCPFSSHHLYHGHIFDLDGEPVDEVLAVLMRAPRTFTREDVAEIHCHGGPILVGRILDLLVDGGARLAQPGEFTFRAFLNGRLDLTRAEAVIDLIKAQSAAAGTLALRQLDGELSRQLFKFRQILLGLLAETETLIDFPEEDIPLPSLQRLEEGATSVAREMGEMLKGFAAGRALKEGLSLLILGPPNVGKSSLLNALLGESRAIVTDIPGTTRDTIEEPLVIGGFPLRVIDTAGIRESEDPVEVEGVRRTLAKIRGADLVLVVVDGSQPRGGDDLKSLEACSGKPVLLVVNKADLGTLPLAPPWRELPAVVVSSHTGAGLDELGSRIVGIVGGPRGIDVEGGVLLSDRRHREALVRCQRGLEAFLEGVSHSHDPELLALELREALSALGEITGETTPEEVLAVIFSRFCVGK